MFSLPSPRRLATPALLLFIIAASVRLYLRLNFLLNIDILHHIGESSARTSHNFSSGTALSPPLSLRDRFLEQYYSSTENTPSNPHVARVLSRCNHELNTHTGHIRLSHVPVLNISMVPAVPEANGDDFKNNKYFNPAILSLPLYISDSSSTPYQYLLISRLVTTGIHQESHICFANICTPSGSSSTSTSHCSTDDLSLLGPAGGMRCITRLEKINIPPTPARKCTGPWKIFPEIPGFHDPRVFWSGRGEPLIEVNSGSEYGCIGLWMQDLRSVVPGLTEILMRTDRRVKDREQEKQGDKEMGRGKESEMMDVSIGTLGARMGYPKLTELTRNPRESRADVEKNWVVFFPSEDEMWVQYNAMGKVVSREQHDQQSADEGIHETEASSTRMDEEVTSLISVAESPASVDLDAMSGGPGLQTITAHNYSAHEQLSKRQTAVVLDTDLTDRSKSSTTSLELPTRNTSSQHLTPDANLNTPGQPRSSHPQPQAKLQPHSQFSSGRTISQILSHGLTTPNLTSPHETPCFNLFSPFHTTDTLNNTGHWHQGTNALRLILCTRSEFRSRTCIPDSRSNPPPSHPQSNLHYTDHLRSEGAILHFSIIHRKFSNEIDLPMRYERYILAWEARAPFRVVGVSRYPFVFGRERVRPWNVVEDGLGGGGGSELEAEAEARSGSLDRRGDDTGLDTDENDIDNDNDNGNEENAAYFTYTPSIAWSHRAQDEDEDTHFQRGHEDLGTGYLGDEVIVGIGMDDVRQRFVRVGVDELVGCLRGCEEV